jgi:hypothetical protein
MKQIYSYLGCITFGIIAGFLFCQQSCSKQTPCPETAVITPVKQQEAKVIESSKPIEPKKVIRPVKHPVKPLPLKYDLTNYQKTVIPSVAVVTPSIPFETDADPCSALWDEFNTVKLYSETYKDSAMSITVNDSVSMNKVFHQSVSYLRLLPDKNITVVKPYKYDLAVGLAFNTLSGLAFAAKLGVGRYEVLYRYYPVSLVHEVGVNVVLWRR